MCGIAGFIDPGRAGDGEALTRRAMAMGSTMRHRGPDDHGVWVAPDVGLGLAFRRLSILDLTDEGHQPMVSASGRHVLVFNGEIYNFRELRRELEAAGVRFRSSSDTEVLLESINRWGIEPALKRVDGMFAFAVWDRRDGVLRLARDRFGEKPLYYGWAAGSFLFGSQLSALRAYGSGDLGVDREAAHLLLRFGYIPEPWSIHRGIRKLAPGSWIEVRPDRAEMPEPRTYWSLAEVAERGTRHPFTGSPSEAVDELEATLRRSVARRMVADVPLGAFLSGGIDSSTVVALMQAQSDTPIRTFTIGFTETGYDEAPHAAEVARHLGTDHTELYVTPSEAQEVIPHLAEIYDEPFADASQVPTTLVSRLARRDVTVALSGDGGDELLGGYSRYELHDRVWGHLARLPAPLRSATATALQRVPPDRWDTTMRALSPVLPGWARQERAGEKIHKLARMLSASSAEAAYREVVTHWPEGSSVVRGAGNPITTLDDPDGWPKLDDIVSRMMFLDGVTYLPGDILAKVDRASMSTSLEVRVPMLAPEVADLAWRLPPEMRFRDGKGKWVLRQVLARHVPPQLFERPKMGFGVPVGDWLRGPLRGWAEELLSETALAADDLLVSAPIRRLWARHVADEVDGTYRLWNVLMLQAWRRSRM